MQIYKKNYFSEAFKYLLALTVIFNLLAYTIVPLYGQSSTCKCTDGKLICTNCNPTCTQSGNAATCMGSLPLCCDQNGNGTSCTNTITCGAGNTITNPTPITTPSSPCKCNGSILTCANCNPVCKDSSLTVACRMGLPLCCDKGGSGQSCITDFSCGSATIVKPSSSSSSSGCICSSGSVVCTNCNAVCRNSGFSLGCRLGLALCCTNGGTGTICNENYVCTTSSGAFVPNGVFCSKGDILCNEGVPICNSGERPLCGALLGFTGELSGPGCIDESLRFFKPGTVSCKSSSDVLPLKKSKCKKKKACPSESKRFNLCRFDRIACKCFCPFDIKKVKHIPICTNKDILNCSIKQFPDCVNPDDTAFCDKGKLYCKDITKNTIDLLDAVECKKKF